MGQYIGARYVPKFMGVYDATQAYENLCVIDNGLGTSYITRKPTPAGTPLTDTTYWAVYGASSGAIINLQNQIEEIKDGFVTPEMFGAAGDGLTDDTQAVKDAINSGVPVVFGGSYLITDQIDETNLKLFGGGILILAYPSDYTIIARGDSKIDGLTFKSTGVRVGYGIRAVSRPSISNCKFDGFDVALMLSDIYGGQLTKCYFTTNNTCVHLKCLNWPATNCTSCHFVACYFLSSYKGLYTESGEASRNVHLDTCVFEYLYEEAINANDVLGIVENCWFEHINNNAQSTAIKGVNSFITDLANNYQPTISVKYDLTQPSWGDSDKGYVFRDKNAIRARKLKLVDKYTQSDTGDRIEINGDGQALNVYLGSNLLGSPIYTPAPKIKVSTIGVNGYQNPIQVADRNSGFTVTKLSTGKYYVDFGRTISSCSIFASAGKLTNTPASESDYDTNITVSDIVTAHVFGINNVSTSNYKQWKQATGAVIMVTNNSGVLEDAHIDVMVCEVIPAT